MGGNELGIRENTGKWVPELLIDRARFPRRKSRGISRDLAFSNTPLEIARSQEVYTFLVTQSGF